MNRAKVSAVLAVLGGHLALVACGTDALESEESPRGPIALADAGPRADGAVRADGGTSSSGGSSSGGSSSGGGALDGGSDGSLVHPMQAEAPTFQPPAGTYFSAQLVTISTTIPGATIYYTTDGTNPTAASRAYTQPIPVTSTTDVRAIALAPGRTSSVVAAAHYEVAIVCSCDPGFSFSPPPGDYIGDRPIAMAANVAGQTLCYTVDGSVPACAGGACAGGSHKYSAGGFVDLTQFTGGETLVVRVLACDETYGQYDLVSASYKVHVGDVRTNVLPGVVGYGTQVTLRTETPGARIRYNFDDFEPSCATMVDREVAATEVTFTIQENTTIRAIACKPGWPSSPSRFEYKVKLSPPTFPDGVGPGVYEATLPAGFATAVSGGPAGIAEPASFDAPAPGTPPSATLAGVPRPGTLCYRAGKLPACTFNGECIGSTTPPAITEPTTLGAIACRERFEPSEVVTATYAFAPPMVSVTGPDNLVPGYVPSSNSLGGAYWNGGPSAVLGLSTPTPAASIRYSVALGTLATPAELTCDQPCPSTAECIECPAGTSCSPGTLPPLSIVRAIACRPGWLPSAPRQVVYADPSTMPFVGPPSPEPLGVYPLFQRITLTASPPDATICFTMGSDPQTLPDPTCSPATGQCTTPLPAPAGVVALEYHADGKPFLSTPTTYLRARACKAGVPNMSPVMSATYRVTP